MKKIIIVICLLLLFTFVVGCSKSSTTIARQSLSGQQLEELIKSNEKALILDVREIGEYQQGHIANSKLIPIGQIEQRISELSKEEKIVVVCASGMRSAQVADFLTRQGFTKVYNLTGGMLSWPGEVVN